MKKMKWLMLIEKTCLEDNKIGQFTYYLFAWKYRQWETKSGKKIVSKRQYIETVQAPTKRLAKKELLKLTSQKNVQIIKDTDAGRKKLVYLNNHAV